MNVSTTTFTTTWTYDKKGNWLMSMQDREDRRVLRSDRRGLRSELFIEAHNNPAALKTKIGQQRLVDAVISRRKAESAKAVDPVKIKRWLQILMDLLPLLVKLFA